MDKIREIAEDIVGREGGFVNDKDDPGGATNRGVTIHTMRRLGLDLDRDGDVDVQDVKLVSFDLAVEIFLRHYFYKPRINQLPEPVQASVFDMQVNAGSNAVKILQRMLASMGYDIAADGAIGPQTTRIATQAFDKNPAAFVDAYGIERRKYYFRIGDRKKTSRKYCVTKAGGKGGWIKRAEEFISPRYHLTDRQFKRRISKW